MSHCLKGAERLFEIFGDLCWDTIDFKKLRHQAAGVQFSICTKTIVKPPVENLKAIVETAKEGYVTQGFSPHHRP